MTNEEKIQKFVDYSRQSREHAISWLEAYKWDIDTAINVYWRSVILTCDIEE